ncbi:MAG: ribosome small subunit-dependent GTPase A [Clostridiales bacterium]|jgi:ribosome biogenesis GTPase|nr:ribosome small subunit-dependent GTPase A [Clostridiales bacterium]
MMPQAGQIIQGRGGLYTVRDEQGQEYVLRAKNKFRRAGLTPLVGDRVMFSPGHLEEHGWLEDILPRTSQSVRPPVANITQMMITLAPEPMPDLLLADKLLVFARMQGIKPLLVVNKADLDPGLHQDLIKAYQQAQVDVIAASSVTADGLEALRKAMAGHLNCFAGQSGVGKSTLITALTGVALETGEVSLKIRRGKQTTRHVSLLEQDGFQVLDTPGFSLLDLPEDMEPEHLRDYYPEFVSLQAGCRFEVCLHDKEPGCAIQEGAFNGRLDPNRLARYRVLLGLQKEKWSKRYA